MNYCLVIVTQSVEWLRGARLHVFYWLNLSIKMLLLGGTI